MHPDLLLLEQGSNDTLPLTLGYLQYPQHSRIQAIEYAYCTRIAYAQSFKERHQQGGRLPWRFPLEISSGTWDMRIYSYICVVLLVLQLFAGGPNSQHSTAQHLKQLGIPLPKVENHLQDLHWKALKGLGHNGGTQCRLEQDDGQGKLSPPRPPSKDVGQHRVGLSMLNGTF